MGLLGVFGGWADMFRLIHHHGIRALRHVVVVYQGGVLGVECEETALSAEPRAALSLSQRRLEVVLAVLDDDIVFLSRSLDSSRTGSAV